LFAQYACRTRFTKGFKRIARCSRSKTAPPVATTRGDMRITIVLSSNHAFYLVRMKALLPHPNCPPATTPTTRTPLPRLPAWTTCRHAGVRRYLPHFSSAGQCASRQPTTPTACARTCHPHPYAACRPSSMPVLCAPYRRLVFLAAPPSAATLHGTPPHLPGADTEQLLPTTATPHHRSYHGFGQVSRRVPPSTSRCYWVAPRWTCRCAAHASCRCLLPGHAVSPTTHTLLHLPYSPSWFFCIFTSPAHFTDSPWRADTWF